MNIESSGIDRVVDAAIEAYMDDHEAWSTNGIADLIHAAAEQGIAHRLADTRRHLSWG